MKCATRIAIAVESDLTKTALSESQAALPAISRTPAEAHTSGKVDVVHFNVARFHRDLECAPSNSALIVNADEEAEVVGFFWELLGYLRAGYGVDSCDVELTLGYVGSSIHGIWIEEIAFVLDG